MGELALIFPGQGSQYVGMGSDLYHGNALFRQVMLEADDRLGIPLSRLCFDGPEEALTLTANAQPAILAVSIAAWRLVEAAGVSSDLVAGHSLGEYSALVVAGCLSLSDAVFAVRRRGELMQEAVPAGKGSMAAILGLDADEVAKICHTASEGEVLEVANFNCPGQVVISGHVAALDRAVKLAEQKGVRRAIHLHVSAPFHSSLMTPAQEGMRAVLTEIEFHDLSVPLINNVDAVSITRGDEAREGLIRQIVSPVRWEESVRHMIKMGIDTFLEIGPGKVLTGLVRRIDHGVKVYSIEDQESLHGALRDLGGK